MESGGTAPWTEMTSTSEHDNGLVYGSHSQVSIANLSGSIQVALNDCIDDCTTVHTDGSTGYLSSDKNWEEETGHAGGTLGTPNILRDNAMPIPFIAPALNPDTDQVLSEESEASSHADTSIRQQPPSTSILSRSNTSSTSSMSTMSTMSSDFDNTAVPVSKHEADFAWESQPNNRSISSLSHPRDLFSAQSIVPGAWPVPSTKDGENITHLRLSPPGYPTNISSSSSQVAFHVNASGNIELRGKLRVSWPSKLKVVPLTKLYVSAINNAFPSIEKT